jgi:hypothetical protein
VWPLDCFASLAMTVLGRALPATIFPSICVSTSRVELTLDANLLPGKVVSPIISTISGEMRPIRQQTGVRRALCVSFALMAETR